MKTVRANIGPFAERPHFTQLEIERICAEELRKAGLYPTTPQPIRIDRFVEKRFNITHSYGELLDGVLGFTKFGRNGVVEIVIAASLEEDRSKSNERRIRTTLAHEAGHGLLHAYLFALETIPSSLFGEDSMSPKILCRDVPGDKITTQRHQSRWWEYQANQAIGGLLLPRSLVNQAIEEFMEQAGSFGGRRLRHNAKDAAIQRLTETFDVNPVVARIRISSLFPTEGDQLSL
jgi:hypothetical protein